MIQSNIQRGNKAGENDKSADQFISKLKSKSANSKLLISLRISLKNQPIRLDFFFSSSFDFFSFLYNSSN